MNDRAETVSSDDPLRTIPPGPEPPLRQPPAEANLPGYEILNELGRGGMGVVYKARQMGLNRIVAVKMILGGSHAGPDERVRFRHEAETLARCQHPNIVQIHDVGTHGDRIYLALEFIDGPTLAQRCGFTPQAPKWSAELVVVLARAVHHAHQQGVVHRDLKPANVLLTADGTPKVTDFGLARRVEGGSGMTHTGTVMGTPSYMPPEQAAGQTKDVGPAADVYALGAILYELLTGRPPFLAQTPYETLTQVIGDDPVPPRRLQTRVPRDLETICLKCLHKLPRRRYDSAAELADDLRRFLAGEPIRGRPSGRAERALKWARRRPAQAVGLVMGLLLLLVLAGGGLWAARQEQAQAERERGLRAEAQKNLYDARILLARQAWERPDIARVLKLLDETTPRPGEDDLRGPEWSFLSRLCRGELFRLPSQEGGAFAVAWSPNGTTLATGNVRGEVTLWDARSRELKAPPWPAHQDNIWSVTFSPDGRLLASSCFDGTVKLWDVSTRRLVRELNGHEGVVYKAAFDRDGRRLASCGGDGTIRIWDTERGDELRVLLVREPRIHSVTFSPDGLRLASGGVDKTVRLWNAETGKEEGVLRGHTGTVAAVEFTPDGAWLVSAGWDTTVRVWDVASRQPRATLTGHADWAMCLAVAPDGKRAASAGADTTVRLWDLKLGVEYATLKGHTGQIRSLAFSPDGKVLVSGSQDGHVLGWDATAGLARRTIPPDGEPEPVRSVALSSDGRTLAATGSIGALRVWDLAREDEPPRMQEAHEGILWFLAFSPDGATLATGSNDNTLRLWRRRGDGWERTQTLGRAQAPVNSLAFTPDGRRVIAGTDHPRGNILVWDLADPRSPRWEHTSHRGAITHVAASPGGEWIAWASRDKTVKLWRLGEEKEPLTLEGHTAEPHWVGFSPDGAVLATASFDTTVRLWDVATGRPLAVLQGAMGPIWCAAFTPDGKVLITGGGERHRAGELKVWNVARRCELANLQGHSAGITALAMSTDGQTLVTADAVGVIKVWDLPRLLGGL